MSELQRVQQCLLPGDGEVPELPPLPADPGPRLPDGDSALQIHEEDIF